MPFSVSYSQVNPNVFRPGNTVNVQIELTEKEQKIRDVIVAYCKYRDEQDNSNGPLVARFTGGWVRDKLLGHQSHDIDIAINTMTGLEFAEGLNDFIAKGPSTDSKTHNIHKIERNPEKSKHLETATTRLFDHDVDIVNLRSESYALDSRIPEMEFGTAEEDAYRRDATVNALFYNLQENKVEDMTGKGLQDLKEGVIRTPLEPFDTFNDDPLRVLRLIRFASTFGFEISPETLDAMSNPKIRESLMLKISRERVGVELTKALTSSRPYVCLLLLHYLNLHGAVFYLAPQYYPSKDFNIPADNIIESISVVSNVVKSSHPYLSFQIAPEAHPELASNHLYSTINKDEAELDTKRLHFWLAVALNHLEGFTSSDSSSKKQNTLLPCDMRIIREGIKLSTNDSNVVGRFLGNHNEGMSVYSHQGDPLKYVSSASRKELGQLIRKLGENWGSTLLYCLFKDILIYETEHKQQQDVEFSQSTIYEFYSSLVDRVFSEELNDAWALKPILNGKEVLPLFGKKGGPWLMNVLADMVDKQLENPSFSKDDAKEWLQKNKENWS